MSSCSFTSKWYLFTYIIGFNVSKTLELPQTINKPKKKSKERVFTLIS